MTTAMLAGVATGLKDAHQDGLDLGAFGVTVAATASLAIDDGHADVLLGGPVGGLHARVVEEDEEVVAIALQVLGEAAVDRVAEMAGSRRSISASMRPRATSMARHNDERAKSRQIALPAPRA